MPLGMRTGELMKGTLVMWNNYQRLLTIVVAIIAGLCGLWAARCWRKAAGVPINPGIGIHSGDIHTQDVE